jgi:L-lactate dehydrogenase complex protein LldG
MTYRAEILGRVRDSLRRGEPGDEIRAALVARLAAPPATMLPARARGTAAELTARFIENAKRAGATVAVAEDAPALAREIARFLAQESLPRAIRMAPDPELDFIAALPQTGFSVARGKAESTDRVSLSRALAGVAETGSLMLASGPGHPMSLALLVEAHVALVPAAGILGSYEEAMVQFRATGGRHKLPRAVTFVTGPSRSADIEQKIQFGAHGPRRLHIVILGKSP